MRAVRAVALDLLREAASRRWFLALGGGITLVLFALALGLEMQVVDGALAATRLFGSLLATDIQPTDVALRPVFEAATYVAFYGGLVFGTVSCADFAPSLLTPGRIEHLLALPVRRWELVLGTFLGVMALACAGALYGVGGLSIVLGAKTGVWTARPLAAALLGSVAFFAVYACMLGAALFVRSAPLSSAVGCAVFALGIVASYRGQVAPLFSPGAGRGAFLAATLPAPRIGSLADMAAAFAASRPVDGTRLGGLVLGILVFALAALAIGLWRFEKRDF